MIWFIWGFLKKSNAANSDDPFISIIVAAHNEEEYLDRCIKALVEQNYPKDKYEVIFINDRSTDQTQTIIDNWHKQYKK